MRYEPNPVLILGWTGSCVLFIFYTSTFLNPITVDPPPPIPLISGLAKNRRYRKTAVKGVIYITKKTHNRDLKIGIGIRGGGGGGGGGRVGGGERRGGIGGTTVFTAKCTFLSPFIYCKMSSERFRARWFLVPIIKKEISANHSVSQIANAPCYHWLVGLLLRC